MLDVSSSRCSGRLERGARPRSLPPQGSCLRQRQASELGVEAVSGFLSCDGMSPAELRRVRARAARPL